MRRTCVTWALALSLATVLAGCGGKAPGPVVMDEAEQEAWEIRLVEMRIDKNDAFREADTTPLPAADLSAFEGLNYYYPVPELRFRVPLVASAKPETLSLVKRKGEQVSYLAKGTVSFRHDNRDYTLTVFGPVDASQHGDYLWLPFYDATSGVDTYGGGRYLDLEIDADDMVDLDFNFAYNPLCDYNPERYNCTLPPADNRLDCEIPAGEKLYRLHE